MQDILDSIEFARGSPESKWGSVRAAMGHREPFDLKYVAIGNEDCGKTYYRGLFSFKIMPSSAYIHINLLMDVQTAIWVNTRFFFAEHLKNYVEKIVVNHFKLFICKLKSDKNLDVHDMLWENYTEYATYTPIYVNSILLLWFYNEPKNKFLLTFTSFFLSYELVSLHIECFRTGKYLLNAAVPCHSHT